MILDFIFPTYCPKCNIKMVRNKTNTNSTDKNFRKAIQSLKIYTCPNCNSVLMK